MKQREKHSGSLDETWMSLWSNLAYLKDNFLMETYFSPVNFSFWHNTFIISSLWHYQNDHVLQPIMLHNLSFFFPTKILMSSSLTSRFWETSDEPGKASWKHCLLTRNPG